MHAPTSHAFTLIELLVVITIIVVLIALLTPALDRAVYQAELAVCGARLKAVGSVVTVYAFDNRRYYPFRDLPPTRTGAGNPEHVTPFELYRPVNTFDMRPSLREVMDINKMLQCPLTDDDLELDDTPVQGWIFGSYATWWGWLYQPGGPETRQRGLFKLGDRFSWVNESYSVLAGDHDQYAAAGGAWASHPDAEGVMALVTSRAQGWVYEGAPGSETIPLTMSVWMSEGNPNRGLVDLNHLLTDGSVQRYTGVEPYLSPTDHDDRMGAVPVTWQDAQAGRRLQVPR